MTLSDVEADPMAARLSLIRPHMDERKWRLLLGAEARAIGRGGINAVAAASGAHPDTVAQGAREVDYPEPIPGRVRRPGAGRPPLAVTDPTLREALEALIRPHARADAGSPLRWTTKSTAKLADQMTAAGHRISARTVAKLLKAAGYSLQANAKAVEGAQEADRDAQFAYLGAQASGFQAAGNPMINVYTKKKELIGGYAPAGREWEPAGEPRQVKANDYRDQVLGKVAPDGVYGLASGTDWVNVGTDADTVQFAVESIRRWWTTLGAAGYPGARQLLIITDPGGVNGSRARLWAMELAAFAAQTGLNITVCHMPPGAYKWNKIEDRLFSAISRDWPRPLETHEVVIELIQAMATTTAPRVPVDHDSSYPGGTKVSNQHMETLEAGGVLTRHAFHGNWNYTISPDAAPNPTAPT